MLSADGEIGPPRVDPLGYEPGVRPVVRVEDGTAIIWGLARRGPSVVVQRVGETLETVDTRKVPTARGFLGGHHPVLACKGGVVIPVGVRGPGAPLRTPPTFPGTMAVAAGHGDRVLGVWVEETRSQDQPGGLRFAWFGGGVTPHPQPLTVGGDVTALDAVATSEGAWVAWVDAKDPTCVAFARVPDGTVERLDTEGLGVDEVKFASEPSGEPGLPVLVMTTDEESILVVDVDGQLLAKLP
jgi:hypothetical protein